MRCGSTPLLIFVSLLSLAIPSFAFSFSYTAPTECGDMTISWTGGTAPFQLLLTPAFNVPRNISIPNSAFNNGKGSFTMQLPVESLHQFLITMSDATGFGTGGVSDLLTAGDPLSGASCDLKPPPVAFEFQLNTALQQCRPYVISDFVKAQQPATITGLIPLGNTFTLTPALGATNYSWTANVKAGTRVLLFMIDAGGRPGGSSDVYTVGASDDNSCINSNSPASTAQSSPTATATSTPNTGGGSSSNGGIIGGAIAGTVVALLVVGSLVWFLMRRRRKARETPHISTHFSKRRSGRDQLVDLMPEPEANYPAHEIGSNYEPVPFVLPDAHSQHGGNPGHISSNSSSGTSEYPPGHPASSWGGNRPSSIATTDPGFPIPASTAGRSSKQNMAFANSGGQPPNTPARFVLHTDAGELPEHAEVEDEVVELPPQYTSLGGPAQRRPSQRQSQPSSSQPAP